LPFLKIAALNLSKIDLDFNCVTEIENETFKFQNKLTHLYLACNKIHKIKKKSLDGLYNLKELDLQFNNIDKIDKVSFHLLNKLLSFNLCHNKIKLIDEELFQGINRLEFINLSQNEFKNINKKCYLYYENNLKFISFQNDNGKNNVINKVRLYFYAKIYVIFKLYAF